MSVRAWEDRSGRHDAIQRLNLSDYWLVGELFEDLRYNLVIDSVIAGNTPAWVYVDDGPEPRAAWIWNRMGTMLLAGQSDEEAFNRALSAVLSGRVVPDARRRRIPSLTLHYSPDVWEAKVGRLLPGVAGERTWRRFYAFDRLRVLWREQIAPGCAMRRIDGELLHQGQLENVGSVVGWVRSFWHTFEDFAERGFGFCLVRGEVITGWCLTVYASGRDVELGLATAPEYRGRGFATLTAAACVEHSIDKGFTPHWHCDEANLASMRVAEKVGFSHPTRYPVYTFRL